MNEPLLPMCSITSRRLACAMASTFNLLNRSFRELAIGFDSKRSARPRPNCFVNQEGGGVAIEFALVATLFMIIVLFIFQLAVAFFWERSVEYSTLQAARSIRIGSVQAAGLSASEFKTQNLCPHLVAGIFCERVVVSVYRVDKSWSPSRSTGTYAFIDKSKPALNDPELDQGSAVFCPGGPGDLVYVDVVYKAPLLAGAFWPVAGTQKLDGEDIILLRATSVVMNEPFDTPVLTSC